MLGMYSGFHLTVPTGYVHTGIFLTEDEINRTKSQDRESWEILQEIAQEKGLPPIDDLYSMTTDGEIVYRKQ